MLQRIYRNITESLKLKTIKNSLSLNGSAKQNGLLKYCILNLLNLNEKDWWKTSDWMENIVVIAVVITYN